MGHYYETIIHRVSGGHARFVVKRIIHRKWFLTVIIKHSRG